MWLLIVLSSVGLAGMIMAFVGNASPYVSLPEARSAQQTGEVHVVADLVKSSVSVRPRENVVDFTLRDEAGVELPVRYRGQAPGNLMEATRMVAVGRMTGDRFESTKLILKCPSKYESQGAN